jgi:hypothetical protein
MGGGVVSTSWDIWSEGFAATGQRGRAYFHGTGHGSTFKEAVIDFASRDPEFAEYFDQKRMTYWGCRLFDNEADARKSFG